MRDGEFRRLLTRIGDLTGRQRRVLAEVLAERTPRGEAVEVADARLAEGASCPRCGGSAVQRWGQDGGVQRFRCRGCGRTFNALTGTPLARLRRRDAWPAHAEALAEGLSVRRAARACGVHRNTAFRWRHRWLQVPAERKDGAFSGIVEADETYFLESRKGSKAWARRRRGRDAAEPPPARPPRRRGGTASKRGLSAEQAPVPVVRDRHGATTDAVLPAVTKAAVGGVLAPILNRDTLLCTDGLGVYRAAAKERGFAHQPLNLKAGARVKERVFHIQHVNAYHGRLKDWMRRFRGVATAYLPNYLGWRRLLERHRDAPPAFPAVLASALG
jgi:transposase-like protein